MQKRKMIIARNIDQQLANKVQEIIPDWELIVGRDQAIWQEHIHDSEIIAGWISGMENYCLQPHSKLRWFQSWSAGVNAYPLDQFEARNVLMTSASGVHAYPISETIFALMLALTRKIHTFVQNQAAKKWHNAGLKLEMHEKTIGIIGVGAIGKETAKIAKAFGMTVLGVRHSAKPTDFVDEMYAIEQLADILPRCDYVVVTLPLTNDTYHLFSAEQFQNMKPSSFFINIGRGEIVNETDLINALKNNIIAGAGLDVFETEPLSTDSPLWDMENVIVTPHHAGATEHYTERLIETILIPNLQDYLNGKTPSVNLVNYQKGY